MLGAALSFCRMARLARTHEPCVPTGWRVQSVGYWHPSLAARARRRVGRCVRLRVHRRVNDVENDVRLLAVARLRGGKSLRDCRRKL